MTSPPPVDSPLPTPTSTPTPISPDAAVALLFIAEHEGIAPNELEVAGEEPYTFPLLGRTYTYVTILYNQPKTFRFFSLLVDPITKVVEPDFNAVRDAERAEHLAQYGKLEPALYERLQKIGDDELLLVAIWLAHTEQERPYDEIVAEIVALYPAAEKALAEKGILWAVDESSISSEIQQNYERLLAQNISLRIRPVATWLEEQGFTVEVTAGMPTISASLPKRLITSLKERIDVAQIFLIEAEGVPESDIAIPTDRTPTVWSRGYTGTGIRIGILELTNINAAADVCLNIVRTRASTADTVGHKSTVAAVAACNDPIKRGMAYGADIVDAGRANTQQDAASALEWATDPVSTEKAHVINWSEGFETDTALHYLDHVYDYWIKYRSFTGIKSAGNSNSNVTTPGKAYNVITVGNVNDQGTASWADDEIWWESNYINPNTGVEKPEVAAPGTNIQTVAAAGQWTGTSFSAPQVSGLAALLMQRDNDLKWYPTAIKAIIMASAVHNTEGSATLSSKDGAGSIDAAQADWIAQTEGNTSACNGPCWWNIATSDSVPGVNGTVERTFKANRGENIRVVITWLSYPDTPTETSVDVLKRNFDLAVLTPDGQTKSSISASNNFEIVNFTATATGQYTIRVTRNSSGDGGSELGGNLLGIAWAKDATYLPDVRRNSGGQTSNIYIRNNGPLARNATITFYNQNGSFNSAQSNSISSKALWVVLPPNNWQGSAIIDGGEDIAAAVRNDGTGISALDTGFTSGNGDIAFETAAATLYAPAVYNNIFGGFNSTFYLQNTSGSSNSVTLTFYGRTGYGVYSAGITLAGNGSGTISTSSVMGSTAWAGSVRITTSAGSVAAKIYEGQGSAVSRTFSAVAGGKSLLYIPAAYKNIWNLTTGLVIQNLHPTNPTNVTVTYCDRDYTACSSEPVFAINANRAAGVNVGTTTALPASWTGSIKIQSSGGVPLGVVVTNSTSTVFSGGYDFNGTNFGSKVVTLPRAAKNAGGRTTGYTIRNVSGLNNVTVNARYYDTSGNLTWTRPISPINAGQVKGFFQGSDSIPDGWEGSIVLEASADIIAIMREDTSTTYGGYNGIPR